MVGGKPQAKGISRRGRTLNTLKGIFGMKKDKKPQNNELKVIFVHTLSPRIREIFRKRREAQTGQSVDDDTPQSDDSTTEPKAN